MQPQVLVVDDERLIADSLVQILKQRGYRASSLYDGEAAVDRAKSCPFDVLICDVVMDGISGIDAAIEIRRILPNCKVFLISGNTRTVDLLAEASQRGHVFDVLAKPVHPTVIIEMLASSSPSVN